MGPNLHPPLRRHAYHPLSLTRHDGLRPALRLHMDASDISRCKESETVRVKFGVYAWDYDWEVDAGIVFLGVSEECTGYCAEVVDGTTWNRDVCAGRVRSTAEHTRARLFLTRKRKYSFPFLSLSNARRSPFVQVAEASASYDYHPPLPPTSDDAESSSVALGDCAICMDAIARDDSGGPDSKEQPDVLRRFAGRGKRRNYALAPCHHLFHTECLERWLAIKVRFLNLSE